MCVIQNASSRKTGMRAEFSQNCADKNLLRSGSVLSRNLCRRNWDEGAQMNYFNKTICCQRMNKNVNRKRDSYRLASRVVLVYSNRKLMMNNRREYTRPISATGIVELLQEEGIHSRT